MKAATTSTLDALLQRRAIRAFDPVTVPPETRERILRAACAAPSSFNSQPYRLVWIETPEKKKKAFGRAGGRFNGRSFPRSTPGRQSIDAGSVASESAPMEMSTSV